MYQEKSFTQPGVLFYSVTLHPSSTYILCSWLSRYELVRTDLALWDVVPAKGAHHEAGVARIRLGAVAGVARAGDEALTLHAVRLRHLGRRRG